VSDDGLELVGLVPNAMVVRDRDPLALTHDLEPLLIGTVGPEVVAVPLDLQASCTEDLRESNAEITIGEEDMVQAACS
jgi:hypothetical protein